MNIKKMLCPVCMKKLVVRQLLPLETLDEHVSDPNRIPCNKPALQCPDGKCPSRLIGCIWDNIEGGLFYIGKYPDKKEKDLVPFIDGIDSPFGSFNRSWQAEKKAENKANKHIFTFPKWFPGILSKMEVHTNWRYTANYDGKITSRKFRLSWIKIEKGFRTYHIWGMRMLIYSLKGLFKAWWSIKKNPNDGWAYKSINDDINIIKLENPEWWRIVSAKVAIVLLKTLPLQTNLLTVKKENGKVLV